MENKRKANIFENYTCQQVNMARNTALQIMNPHLDRSRCWQHLQETIKKTVSFTVQSWQKQIKLCVSSRKGELFKLATFSFQSLMLKLTKKLKPRFAMFENTVKIQLLCIYIRFTATCSLTHEFTWESNWSFLSRFPFWFCWDHFVCIY